MGNNDIATTYRKSSDYRRYYDQVSFEMLKVVDHEKFLDFYEHVADSAVRQAFGYLSDGHWVDCHEGLPLIRNYQNYLEKEIAEKIGTHSIPYWLMLCRRIKPDADCIGVTPWTEALARRVLDVAIMKYGRFGVDDTGTDVRIVKNRWHPDVISEETVLGAYRIERLALELYWSTGAARRLSKNGFLRVTPDKDRVLRPVVENKAEDNRLIGLYDKRSRLFGTADGFGLLSAARHSKLRTTEYSPYGLRLPVINVDGSTEPIVFLNKAGQQQTCPWDGPQGDKESGNYVIRLLDVRPYADLMAQLKAEALKWEFKAVLCFIIYVCESEVKVASQQFESMYQLVQRGYVFWDAKGLFGRIALPYKEIWQMVFGETLSVSECRRAIDVAKQALTLDPDRRKSMMLPDHSSYPLLVPVSHNTIVVDYSTVPTWIHDRVVAACHTGGDFGDLRGDLFEEVVIEVIAKTLPDFSLWKGRKEVLEMEDGTRMEFDATCKRGSLLVVIDDKSRIRSAKFERGEEDEPARRFAQYRMDLTKLRKNAAKLLSNRHGRNYDLPVQIATILPVILTSDVEYIAEDSPDFFLDRDTPVICTVLELKNYLLRTTNGMIAKSACSVPRQNGIG